MLNLMLISPLPLFVVVDDACTVPRVMLNIGIQDGGHHHENVIKFDRGEGAPSELGGGAFYSSGPGANHPVSGPGDVFGNCSSAITSYFMGLNLISTSFWKAVLVK